ncbi:MAG: 1-acyl-sn-glycerol-3-phosphate acyltransferase [Robiginitomaculum sp.]|nr:1-acyl-sn-glycerol-3-phosphate acyltransferase [Robiginitomaculum sp.]
MKKYFRQAIQIFIARPVAHLLIGLDIIGKEHLPTKGPAIVAANHNSHIDTLILLSLFSSRVLPDVRPVGAADHFLRTRTLSWISRYIIGMIPIHRKKAGSGEDLLADCKTAMAAGKILVIFPEGTRGEAEEMKDFKTGVARLAEQFPDAPVTPVYIQGAGRVMPRGSKLLVPFNCTAVIGKPIKWSDDGSKGKMSEKYKFMKNLKTTIKDLSQDAPPMQWD